MLSKLKIINFRQHRSLELGFGEGLTAIRGPNEAGKSTLGEAIAYALFGVKACRSPLADVVTWGEAEASLKVELDLVVDGVTYSVKRGKSGAETVYGGDGMVTGQTEVTNFMARLLKVDASSASKLMFSNQKEIAAALEAGTKATTELIERLAEFDQIDNLIELMQEKLSLGSGAQAQAQLDAATARLDRARSVAEPDLESLVNAVAGFESAVSSCNAELLEAQDAREAAQTELAKAQASASEREAVAARLKRFEARHTAAMNEMTALKVKTAPRMPDADDLIQKLLAQKADAGKAAQVRAAWEAVRHLVGDTGIGRFEGNAESWQSAVRMAQAGLDSVRAGLRGGDVKFAALQAKLSSGNCTFCGQDFSDLPEVKAKNTEIQVELDVISAGLVTTQKYADAFEVALKSLNDIQAGGRATLAAIQKYAEYLDIDDSSYPPFLAWKGEEPTAVTDTASIDNEIKRIRLAVREAADHTAAIQANDLLLESFDTERTEIAERQAALGPLVKTERMEATLKSWSNRVAVARETLATATASHTEAKEALKDAQRNWEWAQKESTEAATAVEVSREALLALDFNNALLKRVRAARPLIADKLWNLVLASVSSYFSEMRGEKSRVTKGPDGFMIDDHPVPSFSGSTIDILGLAIRVALVRTFLPSCPFLLLDEPAAACSDTRTDSMLGFLQGCGYKQILLITHEDVSESVADHIITLGE